MENDGASQRVADEPDGKLTNHVQQNREVQHMLGHRIDGPWSPSAVAVAAQIKSIDVIMLTQRARDPIPVARMVQPSMNQHYRRQALPAVVPELQLQSIGIKEMGNRFHS